MFIIKIMFISCLFHVFILYKNHVFILYKTYLDYIFIQIKFFIEIYEMFYRIIIREQNSYLSFLLRYMKCFIES